MENEASKEELDMFFMVLKEKFPKFLQKVVSKQLILLVPPKYLLIKSMLHCYFYSNHLMYPSPYEPGKYINLNGKVLDNIDNTFTSSLGWMQRINFSVKERVYQTLPGIGFIEYQAIDCLCDDIYGKKPDSKTDQNADSKPVSKPVLKPDSKPDSKADTSIVKLNMQTMAIAQGYMAYYYQTDFASIAEYRTAEKLLEHFLELMNNHFILTKTNEDSYFQKFKVKLAPVFDAFRAAINAKFIVVEQIIDQVVCELIQSLIFNKKNLYNNIMDKLILFTAEEEQYYFEKIKENKNDFSIASLTKTVCKEDQLEEAKKKMQELPEALTFFEKNRIYQEINGIINALEREMDKKPRKPTSNKEGDANFFLSVWIYLLSQETIANVFAEVSFYCCFQKVLDYKNSSVSETGYISTILASALETLKSLVDNKASLPVFKFNQKILTMEIKVDISAMQSLAKKCVSGKIMKKKLKTEKTSNPATPQG